MLKLDSKLKNRITKYLEYVLYTGLNLGRNDVIEILGPYSIKDTIELICDIIRSKGNNEIIITYTSGNELLKEINEDWQGFLNKRIDLYNSLINKGFLRLTLLSPFSIPLPRTDNVDRYLANASKLAFVNDYINSNINQHTIAAIPNIYWASKLQIDIDTLWEEIIDLSCKENKLIPLKNILNSLKITNLYFKSNTVDLSVKLIDNCKFLDSNLKTINGINFISNIPSLEIFRTPNKYGINGKITSSKPLFYKNKVYENVYLEFKDGRVINSNIPDILSISPSLEYIGEIALAKYQNNIFYSTLLDENLGCHLALGKALFSPKNENINESNYHIDIVFGTKDLDIFIECNNEKIKIMEKGEFIWILKQ